MTRPSGLAALVAAVFLGGCMIQNQTAPPLSGPSGFGRQLRMTATPDTLPRDGSSQSVIRMTYTDHENKPLSRRVLLMSSVPGTLSAPEVTTDASGQAAFTLTAPGANVNVDAVVVTAIPVANESDSADGANVVPQSLAINVLGADVPVASFTFSPASPALGGSVTFDASGTTLNGTPCGAVCTYSWDFGDGTSATGQLAQHTFQTTGVHTITLTVSAPGGTSSSTSRSFAIAPPAAPRAAFIVSPSSPVANQQAVFDATTSSVGTGASIVLYTFNFGDGTGSSSSVPIVTKTYAAPGTVTVSLTVTDSLGRTASVTVAVTVVP
jgi:PKD repeat protein